MPIEFRCSQCGKLLRTGDDTVGRQAQCPECGAITVVPNSAVTPPRSSVPPLAPMDGGSPFGAGPAAGVESSENPYQAPSSPAYYATGQIDFAAAQRVAGPATALMVIAIVEMLLQVLIIVVNLAEIGMGPEMRRHQPEMFPVAFGGGINAAGGVFGLAMAAVVLIGAMKMKKLESYGMAMAAAIIAIIPCFQPCCVLGMPFGIWALVVLSDISVRAAFRS